MAATIITPRHRVDSEEWRVEFWDSSNGWGWSFDSTEDGQITRAYWPSLNRAIAEYCDGTMTVNVERDHRSWIEPAEALCPCGATVWLEGRWDGDGCEACGRLFNLSGHELAPKHLWEEREYDDDSHTIAEYAHAYDD